MISFECVRWKNFLSTGNVFTEIELNKTPSTLVVGVNGSGKSSMADAICFGLYGRPFRKINKDQIPNSINGRDTVVEIEFTTYNNKYKIVRGIHPNIFEIYKNGEILNQTATSKDYQEILERSILRMNLKSFTQIVILGSSSFVPFMQLPAAARREVIEDLLDIRVFSTMSSLLKSRVIDMNKNFIITEKDISSTKEIVSIQEENHNRIKRDNEKLIVDARLKIEKINEHITIVKKEIDVLREKIKEASTGITDDPYYVKKRTELFKIRERLVSKKTSAEKNISFYKDNDHCPTCAQDISAEIKTEKITHKQKTVSDIISALSNLVKTEEEVEERMAEISAVQNTIKNHRENIVECESQIKQDKRETTLHEKHIDELSQNKNNNTQTIIQDLTTKLADLNSTYEKLLRLKDIYEIAEIILRDTGIKARIVKQYIPVINTLVNKYLAAMDFFVKFELNEAFQEKILSRHRDDFSYESFSEGEKMRIDLSLLFTWRTVARMKNSASTNLLILDEVFDASLDANGCDEFLKLIHNLENANIFVMSHKGDLLQDKFQHSIRFEKHNNFSRIVGQ